MSEQQAPAPPRGIWLALSGGGFRAALFHYGCLKRLRELGLLRDVYAVSAASGGALAAALLAQSSPSNYDDAGREQSSWQEFERRLLTEATRGLLGPIPLALLLHGLVWAGVGMIATAGLLAVFGEEGSWRPWIQFANGTGAAALLAWIGIVVWLRAVRNDGHRIRTLAAFDGRFDTVAAASAGSLLDHISTALSPAAIRLFILHHRVHEQMPLGSLAGAAPQVFLIAADLNTGREIVFSTNVAADLSAAGATLLWNQQWRAVSAQGGISQVTLDNPRDPAFRVSYAAFEIPISRAVAASSAYPPFFSPVVIAAGGELVGSMVDGGVIDNHAMNVAYQMAKHIHDGRGPNVVTTFDSQTSHVLAIDASAPAKIRGRPTTSRLRALLSLPDILHSRQVQSALDDARDVARLSRVKSAAVGLRVGLPEGCEFSDGTIAYHAARIRTHFDAFSRIECAVLAYLGYRWIEYWARSDIGERYRGDVPLRSFATILPEPFSLGPLSETEIVSHLRQSHYRLGLIRRIARRLNLPRR